MFILENSQRGCNICLCAGFVLYGAFCREVVQFGQKKVAESGERKGEKEGEEKERDVGVGDGEGEKECGGEGKGGEGEISRVHLDELYTFLQFREKDILRKISQKEEEGEEGEEGEGGIDSGGEGRMNQLQKKFLSLKHEISLLPPPLPPQAVEKDDEEKGISRGDSIKNLTMRTSFVTPEKPSMKGLISPNRSQKGPRLSFSKKNVSMTNLPLKKRDTLQDHVTQPTEFRPNLQDRGSLKGEETKTFWGDKDWNGEGGGCEEGEMREGSVLKSSDTPQRWISPPSSSSSSKGCSSPSFTSPLRAISPTKVNSTRERGATSPLSLSSILSLSRPVG